jgi:hypothetical protein
MEGKGKLIWKGDVGREYEGDFVKDKFHGKGLYTQSNGRVYEGEWRDGHKDGAGV